MVLPSFPKALLVLSDGTCFSGYAIGAAGRAVGELVFNTAMTGYQEILTDPSYAKQMITFTSPHIGNVGVNEEDVESSSIFAAGMVIKDLPILASNFRMKQSLQAYLQAHQVVAIAGVDTRQLTTLLREKGAQTACILTDSEDVNEALRLVKSFPSMAGMDLAKQVSTKHAYVWKQMEWQLEGGYPELTLPKYHVVAFDFGIKKNILRMLAQRGCQVTVVPATTSAQELLALQPDGVFFSNGPGDPEPCDYAIVAARALIEKKMPLFGICLGHQILALALGARTVKMKTGHHGANHPVKDLKTGRVEITSQNHGFVVDVQTLPHHAKVTHVSLFDGTLQGFELTDRPVFGFQGHPEASPGPHDLAYLFDQFVDQIKEYQQK